ncbi:MAG: hypothetical protein ACR2K2_14175 [Mycobacteriales bacterium]
MLDGEPRDALRTLRADYENARQDDEQRRADRAGTTQVRAQVESVRVVDRSGRTLTSLRPGDDVVLESPCTLISR